MFNIKFGDLPLLINSAPLVIRAEKMKGDNRKTTIRSVTAEDYWPYHFGENEEDFDQRYLRFIRFLTILFLFKNDFY